MHRHRFATVVLCLALALAALAPVALGGCISISRTSEGIRVGRQAPASSFDTWDDTDMSDLLKPDGSWFDPDSNGRGDLQGYATGLGRWSAGGGWFELAIVVPEHDVAVQRVVRVHFDAKTPMRLDGKDAGTVAKGMSGGEGYNVLRGDRVLTVRYRIEDGVMEATRVTAPADPDGRVP